MIKLNNVCKAYISKSKQRVEALKNVSLEIDGAGMVFILGKSGSGKSTLLNLLGGIDSATSGEITVNGVSFADFNRTDYENYRNDHVGFVFQDFNLLNEINVCDNVALALQLSSKTDVREKVADALAAVGLSQDYMTRRINELSGGEKQRIAIARAVVKDSSIILADEPTGNLDSETSDGIWRIFKKLAETKTVIIVTHDRDSAEEFGDRIIKIADGAIVSDTLPEQPVRDKDEMSAMSSDDADMNIVQDNPDPKEPDKKSTAKKRRLKYSVCFKLGLNSLLKHKVKSFFALLVTAVTILGISIAQIISSFSAEKTISAFIIKNDVDYIGLTQGRLTYGNEFRAGFIMKPRTKRYISANAKFLNSNKVKSYKDIINIGLSFIGNYQEIDDSSFYFTAAGLEDVYKDRDSAIMIDGRIEKLNKEQHPPETLAGKSVSYISDEFYTCAGVVNTTKCHPYTVNLFPPMLFNENFVGNNYEYSSVRFNEDEDFPELTWSFGNIKYSRFMSANRPSYLGTKVITADGMKDSADVVLGEGEFMLTYELYSSIFGAKPKLSYVSPDLNNVIELPEHLGKSFPIKVSTYQENELLANIGEQKLVGIAVNSADYSQGYYYKQRLMYALNPQANKHLSKALSDCYTVIVQVSSIKDISDFLVDFRDDYTGYVYHSGIVVEQEIGEGYSKTTTSNISSDVYYFEHNIYEFKIIFWGAAALLSLITVLIITYVIAFSISSRKKEIGILSALGTRRIDLIKIFITETLIISAITFILGLIGSFVISWLLNNVVFRFELISVPLFRIDIITALVLIGSSFVIPVLATLIPLRRIYKLKPIDAIKAM